MTENHLKELKKDMNDTIFRDMHFTYEHKQKVFNKMNVRKDSPFNVKLMFSYTVALVVLGSFFISLSQQDILNIQSNQEVVKPTTETQTYDFTLDQQLIKNAKQGIFSPIPSVTLGMTTVQVKQLLGQPSYEEQEPITNTVSLIYDNIGLIFNDNGYYTSLRNIKYFQTSVSQPFYNMDGHVLNITKSELIEFLGEPIYEGYRQDRGIMSFAFVNEEKPTTSWYLHFRVNPKDKETIYSVNFTDYRIRYQE